MAIGGFWFCLVYIFIGRIVSNEGAHNLAAMGLGHRVETMAFTVAQGFSVGAATLVGQWVGAQRHRQAAKAAAMSATLCGVSLAIFGGVVFMGVEPLLKIFTQDAAIVEAAMGYLQINAVVFAFMGIEAVYEGAFTGLGNTYPTLMVGIIINGVRVPVALALAQGMGMGINGVWLTIAISTVAKSVAKWYLFHQQIDKLDGSHKANMLDDSTKANTLNDSDIAKTLDDSNQANVLDDSRKANMLEDST
jgi:Na+-driven multidrug efflux pump